MNSDWMKNLNLAPEELPQLEDSDFHGLEQDYLYMRLTSRVLFFILLAGVAVILTFSTGLVWWHWLLPWGLILLFLVVVEFLGFKIKGYSIRQKDVSYRSGLLFFKMTSVPLNRIQHCELSQGPLGRLFDLASVKVFTAGGATSDMVINGLTKERAQKLRDYITKLSADYE